MDTPCCLTAAASAASMPSAQCSLRDLSDHASTPRHVQGSPWEKCRTAIFTHRYFNFDKREPGFLIFIEGCEQRCYPKVHQNIHSGQTYLWISTLRGFSCQKLFLNQVIYLFNCAGRGGTQRSSCLQDLCRWISPLGAFFFLSLQTGVSGHHPLLRSCVLWHRMPEVKEWERGPRLVFLLCGEKKKGRKKEEHGSSSAQLWQDFTCMLCVAVAACACKDSLLGRHDLAAFL